MNIKLIKSSFYHEAQTKQKLISFIQKTSILSMGKECLKYETAFAKKQKRRHAVFVSSGSAANLLLIQALLNLGRLKQGDYIGFSAMTWPTNVMPMIQLGMKPVPLDCELVTLNTSPDQLEQQLDRLQGLFLTNVLGFCDNIKKIAELCKKKNIVFLEDNCESLGSKAYGKLLGNFGVASTFSFFVGHHLSTIEGGMICTDDQTLYEMLVMARAHGWDRNLSLKTQARLRQKHHTDSFFAKYTFYDLAYNVRPTEINGFLGNEQLRYWDRIVQSRVDHFYCFHQATLTNPHFIPLELGHMEVVSNFSMPMIAKDREIFEYYKNKFETHRVEIRPIIAGDMTHQPFYQQYVSDRTRCPRARFIHSHGFYFGNNPEMTRDEIDYLCRLIRKR